MKPRDPRRKVVIPARIRIAEIWGDALILNISSRGLLIQAVQPPRRGTYVELRRGHHVIIARAVWSGDGRFGVLTQDPVPIEAVIREPDRSTAGKRTEERRDAVRRPRPTVERHEVSRRAGRQLEFACCIVLGTVAASTLFFMVGDALASPLIAVSSALD